MQLYGGLVVDDRGGAGERTLLAVRIAGCEGITVSRHSPTGTGLKPLFLTRSLNVYKIKI